VGMEPSHKQKLMSEFTVMSGVCIEECEKLF
jgi:hypothetical protein